MLDSATLCLHDTGVHATIRCTVPRHGKPGSWAWQRQEPIFQMHEGAVCLGERGDTDRQVARSMRGHTHTSSPADDVEKSPRNQGVKPAGKAWAAD